MVQIIQNPSRILLNAQAAATSDVTDAGLLRYFLSHNPHVEQVFRFRRLVQHHTVRDPGGGFKPRLLTLPELQMAVVGSSRSLNGFGRPSIQCRRDKKPPSIEIARTNFYSTSPVRKLGQQHDFISILPPAQLLRSRSAPPRLTVNDPLTEHYIALQLPQSLLGEQSRETVPNPSVLEEPPAKRRKASDVSESQFTGSQNPGNWFYFEPEEPDFIYAKEDLIWLLKCSAKKQKQLKKHSSLLRRLLIGNFTEAVEDAYAILEEEEEECRENES